MTYRRFSVPGKSIKNFYQFLLTTKRIYSSLEDGIRLLVTSKHLLRFWLVVSWDLANLGKSSTGICMAILGKSSSGIRPINWHSMKWKSPVSHFDWLKPYQKSLSRCNLVLCSSRATLSLKYLFKNLPGLQFIMRDRMSLVTPQNFEWPDNTFKGTKLFMLRVLVKSVGSRGPTPTVLYKSGKDTSRCFSKLYYSSM